MNLSQAAAGLRDGLSEDLVVLTFDDGYAGTFEAAWPVLASEDVPATVFLTTGFLDGAELWFDFAFRALRAVSSSTSDLPAELQRLLVEIFGDWPGSRSPTTSVEQLKSVAPDQRDRLLAALREADLPLEPAAAPLTWAAVREMLAGGVEFGGHTVSHPILPLLPPELQEEEIRVCRQRMAAEMGQAPVCFAYPNGAYNEATMEIVRRLGFIAACTTRRGSNRAGCDPLRLRRIGVGSDPSWVLSARLSDLFDEEVRRRLPPPLRPIR